MDRGIYNATAAGLVADRQMSIVSNNLANLNTAGFKGQRLVMRQQEFADTLVSTINNRSPRAESDQLQTPGIVDMSAATNFNLGSISSTGDPLNVALGDEKTFFSVQTPEGEAYTRAGNFTLNAQRQLVTQDGMPVISDGGPIELTAGSPKITSTGAVTVDGKTIAKLKVVTFDDLTKLERTEGVRFKAQGVAPQTVDNPNIIPESLEMPNVNVVSSMVDLIGASKAFEAYTKTVRTIDELNERALRSGRTSGA